MNKRLRRKKHVGEFAEYGFLWEVKLRKHLDDEAYMDLMDGICGDWHEKHICLSGGGRSGKNKYSPRMGGYAHTTNEKGKPFVMLVESDLDKVHQYLTQRPEVEICLVGKLDDMWWNYNKHGHRVSKWKDWEKDEEWDKFHLEADLLLGPNGPRCCLGGYIWRNQNGERGCSKCRKPYNGET
jgi:uncharacterized protein YggL (DUF469 family)